MKTSIFGLTLEQLTKWLLDNGQKKYRAEQIWDWLYIKRITDFAQMANVSKECVQLLED